MFLALALLVFSFTAFFLLSSTVFATSGVNHTVCRNCHINDNPEHLLDSYNCNLCHDKDGVATLAEIHAPNIGVFLRQSAHMKIPTINTDTDGRKLSERCVQCHDNKGDAPKLQRSPFNLTNEENLCFSCHKQGGTTPESGLSVTAPDIESDFSRNSRHAITGTTGDGLGGAKVECSSCHNPHVVQDGATDAIKKVVDPSNTFGLWTGSFTEFCLKCHQDNADTPKETDTEATFVPYTINFPFVDSVFSPFFAGWDKTAYRESAHGEKINGEDGQEKVQCNKCHRPHSSDNDRLNAFNTDGQQSVDLEVIEKTYNLDDVLDDASYPVQSPVVSGENVFGDFGIDNNTGGVIPSRAFLRYKLDIPEEAQIIEANLIVSSNWNSWSTLAPFTAKIGLIDQDNVSSFSNSITIDNPTWGLPIDNNNLDWIARPWSIDNTIESPDLKTLIDSFISRNNYQPNVSYVGLRVDEGNADNLLNFTTDRQYFDARSFKNYESDPNKAAKLKVVYSLVQPRNGNDKYDIAAGNEEKLCFQCHRPNNNQGAPDVFSAIRQSKSHNKVWDNGKHKDTENNFNIGDSNRHSECSDCHDPHKAKKGNHQLGNNLASGPIQGAKGVGVINGAAGTAPIFEPKQITYEYELCLKCHSSYALGYTGKDKAVELNPANAAYHPIEGIGKNLGIKDEAFVLGTPWNPTAGDDPDYGLNSNIENPNARINPNYANGARVTCSDCHGNSSSTAKGPHGSSNSNVLKMPVPQVCYQCHRPEVYGNYGSQLQSTAGEPTRFRAHYAHVTNRGGTGQPATDAVDCLGCHGNLHGSPTQKFLIDPSKAVLNHNEGGSSSCDSAICHVSPQTMTYTDAYPHFNDNYNPNVYIHNESFDNTNNKDTINTTADWDIISSELKLPRTALEPWTAQPSVNAPDVGANSEPALADLDGDSDFDLLIGEFNGISYAYRNIGNNASPAWSAKATWNAPDIGFAAAPAFADLNNDGKKDLMIGAWDGRVYGYKNTGTTLSPKWTAWPAWDSPNRGDYAKPALADVDNDSDVDLMIGSYNDSYIFYPTTVLRNTGTIASPTWAASGWNVPTSMYTRNDPTFADLDYDGDLDLMIGQNDGGSYGFKNQGSNSSPNWVAQSSWNAPGVGSLAAPAFADLDNDGKKDLIIGSNSGVSYAYRNSSGYIASKNIGVSTTVDIVSENIIKATLTATESNDIGTSVSYRLTRDGGLTWENVTNGVEYTFSSSNSEKSDLRWRATLNGTNVNTPIIAGIKINYTVQQ